MRSTLRQLIQAWTSGFWFIPSLLTVVLFVLGGFLVWLDFQLRVSDLIEGNTILLSSGEGATRLLATIAGSTISVAGVTFSVTILVLSSASAQFGPGLLGNFMEHRGTQLVLGTFVGAFTYSVVVLRFVDLEGGFVPHLAVNVGLLIGLVAFLLLIYFINHVATFIRVANVIDDVAARMETVLNDFFPKGERNGAPDDEKNSELAERVEREGRAITVEHPGYLQVIVDDRLLEMAAEKGLVVLMHRRPGHFLVTGARLASICPADRVDDEIIDCVHACTIIGTERTIEQDPEYAVQQLVEIGARALSTGVNDPFTAINCLNRLASAFAQLASRQLPSRYVKDKQDGVRLLLEPFTYAGIIEAGFNQYRQNSVGKAAVVFRLLEVITELGHLDVPDVFRDALQEQLDAVRVMNQEIFRNRIDRQGYEQRCERAAQVLAKKRNKQERSIRED